MLIINNPNIKLELSNNVEAEPLFKQIVQQIEDGTFRLSFSKMYNFLDSPRSFMQYCMRTQERTKAMKYGSMIHHWLLEQSTFNDNYKVAPECNLTTTIGKTEYLEFLRNEITDEKFREFEQKFFVEQERANEIRLSKFKPTKAKPECEFKTVWTYKDLQEFVESENNIEIVRDGDMQKAKKQADAVLNDRDFRRFIYPRIEYTEKTVKNIINRYEFSGKIDMGGNGWKGDLKTVTDADPYVLSRQIPREKRHLQGLVYNNLDGNLDDDYFNITVDGNFQTSVVRMSHLTMMNAEYEMQRFFDEFECCILTGSWWESYSFWNKNNIFEI